MNKNAQRIGIYGRSGSGKSTYAKKLMKGNNRVIVFDPMDEYRALKGFVAVGDLKQLKEKLAKQWGKGFGFKIAYVPRSGYEKKALHTLCRFLLQVQEPYRLGRETRKVTLVIEEMNLSFPVTQLPEELNGFPEICSRGRHYGIEVIGISQRLAEVNTRFRGNCNETVLFPLADHADVTTAVKMIGTENKDVIKNLPDHHYLLYRSGKITRGKNRVVVWG